MPEQDTLERKQRERFTPEIINEIRTKRAETDQETGRAVYSHKALAEMFNTTPGTISQIVRNRVYKDANYKPVNDGN